MRADHPTYAMAKLKRNRERAYRFAAFVPLAQQCCLFFRLSPCSVLELIPGMIRWHLMSPVLFGLTLNTPIACPYSRRFHQLRSLAQVLCFASGSVRTSPFATDFPCQSTPIQTGMAGQSYALGSQQASKIKSRQSWPCSPRGITRSRVVAGAYLRLRF